jgi:hypothetical protein
MTGIYIYTHTFLVNVRVILKYTWCVYTRYMYLVYIHQVYIYAWNFKLHAFQPVQALQLKCSCTLFELQMCLLFNVHH